jgi:ribosomal protein S27E
LEPACGKGHIVRVIEREWPSADLRAVDIDGGLVTIAHDRSASRTCYACDDFLTRAWAPGWDLLLTNPPYSLALPFVEKGITLARWAVFLLPLPFLAGISRLPFWARHPADVYVLAKRPSFVVKVKCEACGWTRTFDHDSTEIPDECPSCGGKLRRTSNDATDYAWFVWGPAERERRKGTITHLDIFDGLGREGTE